MRRHEVNRDPLLFTFAEAILLVVFLTPTTIPVFFGGIRKFDLPFVTSFLIRDLYTTPKYTM